MTTSVVLLRYEVRILAALGRNGMDKREAARELGLSLAHVSNVHYRVRNLVRSALERVRKGQGTP